MSLSGSQRDTCTTSGVSHAGARPERNTSARRSTRPGVPSLRTNPWSASSGGGPSTSPVWTRIVWIDASLIERFLVANASMLGVMISLLPWSQMAGTYVSREKTKAGMSSR